MLASYAAVFSVTPQLSPHNFLLETYSTHSLWRQLGSDTKNGCVGGYNSVCSLENSTCTISCLILLQDSCFEVREKFTKKLHKALDQINLPLDYLGILALAATEPSKDRKTQVLCQKA